MVVGAGTEQEESSDKKKKQYVGFWDFGLSWKFSDNFLFPYFLIFIQSYTSIFAFILNAFFFTCMYVYNRKTIY